MNRSSRIYIAGHNGLLGSAIERRCRAHGFANLILQSRRELDLRDQNAVDAFFRSAKPEYVFLAAAVVGGIYANSTRPADFICDNIEITSHVLESARRHGTRKLLFLGSSCIYPRDASQPMREEYILTGALEPTNESYAIAKLAGMKMCQALRQQHGFDAITALPSNIYGPGDNFDLRSSHVLPALVRKIDRARTEGAEAVTIWGTGTARREFLYADDAADACIFLMQHYSETAPINVGCGQDLSVRELASIIARLVSFKGQLKFDVSRPDGMPRKLLDVSRLTTLGWRAQTDLETGIYAMWHWYRSMWRDRGGSAANVI